MSDKQVYRVTKELSEIRFELNSILENVDLVAKDTKQFLKESGFEKCSFVVRLGLREGLTNAVRHAHKGDSSKIIRCKVSIETDRVVVEIHDEGPGFNWKKAQNQTPVNKSDHGRGLGIMQNYFDEVIFNDTGNIVRLVLRL